MHPTADCKSILSIALFVVIISVSAILPVAAADLKAKDAYKSFVERKDYEGGVTAFEREIAADPTNVALLAGLGQLHYSFAKYTEAKLALERALTIDPNHAVARNFLGILQSQLGHQTAALKELDLAIKADPDYADAHFNRAVVLATSNPPNRVAARASYERAITLGCERDSALEQLIK